MWLLEFNEWKWNTVTSSVSQSHVDWPHFTESPVATCGQWLLSVQRRQDISTISGRSVGQCFDPLTFCFFVRLIFRFLLMIMLPLCLEVSVVSDPVVRSSGFNMGQLSSVSVAVESWHGEVGDRRPLMKADKTAWSQNQMPAALRAAWHGERCSGLRSWVIRWPQASQPWHTKW